MNYEPRKTKDVIRGPLAGERARDFTVIRGFAELRDLAEVSVAMPYQGAMNGQGTGYQRQLDEQHVEDIKRFLNKGRYRFFPEIVLSLRSKARVQQ